MYRYLEKNPFLFYVCNATSNMCLVFCISMYIIHTKQLLDCLNTLSKRVCTLNLRFSMHSCSDISLLTL